MKNSLKGALLSGLVFPGVGQIVLKQHRKGAFLIFVVLSGLIMFITIAVRKALAVLEKIQAAGGVLDSETINRTANQATTDQAGLLLNFLLLFLIFCWIFGVIDAYILGKKKDVENGINGTRNFAGQN